MTPERLGLLWGITVFAGACARLFSSLTGFPSVVILLLSGLLIGRSGLGLVEPLDLCTDNAAMIGAAALFRIKFKDHLSSLKLGVAGRLSIEQANTLYEENPPF